MPSEEENVQYLYLVLTNGGTPTIDWEAVGEAMDLKKGAVSKRWSRLKKAMDIGETPGPAVYKFLWLCVKHSSRDKVMNWNEIAEQCNTSAGAASKRYSRMKQAFEAGGGSPGSDPNSPTPKTPSKATPKKAKATPIDGEATPTLKRKRAAPNKEAICEEEMDVKSGLEHDEDEDMVSPKKAKVATPKATPKSKATSKTQVKKEEVVQELMNEMKNEIEDGNVDAKEWVNDLVGGETETDEEGQPVRVNEWLNEV